MLPLYKVPVSSFAPSVMLDALRGNSSGSATSGKMRGGLQNQCFFFFSIHVSQCETTMTTDESTSALFSQTSLDYSAFVCRFFAFFAFPARTCNTTHALSSTSTTGELGSEINFSGYCCLQSRRTCLSVIKQATLGHRGSFFPESRVRMMWCSCFPSPHASKARCAAVRMSCPLVVHEVGHPGSSRLFFQTVCFRVEPLARTHRHKTCDDVPLHGASLPDSPP